MAEDRTYSYDVFSRLTDRWPRADDLLFTPGRGSHLPKDATERNYRLLRGYKKRAGDLLVQAALTDQYDRRSLVFPAIFSYRHYVELALKALVEDHGSYAAVPLGPKNHKLADLWQLFVKIATAFGYDCSDATISGVGKCVATVRRSRTRTRRHSGMLATCAAVHRRCRITNLISFHYMMS